MEKYNPSQSCDQAEKEVVQPALEVIPPTYKKVLPPPPVQSRGVSYDYAVHNPTSYEELSKPEQRILGFTRRTFFIIFFVVLFILIGATIGGSVGGFFAGKSHSNVQSNISASQIPVSLSTTRDPQASSSPTSTPATASLTTNPGTTTPTPNAQFPNSGILDNPCPAADQTIYNQTVTSTIYSFRINCGTNYLGSTGAIAGSNTTTIQECMNSCAWMNNRLNACVGVVWQANLTEAEKPNQLANCWLVGAIGTSGTGGLDGTVASANLDSKSEVV